MLGLKCLPVSCFFSDSAYIFSVYMNFILLDEMTFSGIHRRKAAGKYFLASKYLCFVPGQLLTKLPGTAPEDNEESRISRLHFLSFFQGTKWIFLEWALMSPPAFKKKKATKSLQQNLGLCRWLKNILWPNIIGGIWGELPSATKKKQDQKLHWSWQLLKC